MTVDGDGQRQRVKTGTETGLARHLTHVALDLIPSGITVGVFVTARQIRHHALVTGLVDAGASVAVLVPNFGLALHALAVQQQVVLLGGELLPGLVHRDRVRLTNRLDQAREVLAATAGPRLDSAASQRLLNVGDHQPRVDLIDAAQAVALRTRAVGRVEREVTRSQLVEGLSVRRSRQVLTEDDRLPLALFGNDLQLGDATGQAQRCLDRISETATDAVTKHQTIDHDRDVVGFVAFKLDLDVGTKIDDLAVDQRPHKAL